MGVLQLTFLWFQLSCKDLNEFNLKVFPEFTQIIMHIISLLNRLYYPRKPKIIQCSFLNLVRFLRHLVQISHKIHVRSLQCLGNQIQPAININHRRHMHGIRKTI